jgi:hypothetical protein
MRISGGLSISISQLDCGNSDLVDAPCKLLNQVYRKISILSNKLSESILSPELLRIAPCYPATKLKSNKTREEIGMQDFLKGSRRDSAVQLSLQFHEVMALPGFW